MTDDDETVEISVDSAHVAWRELKILISRTEDPDDPDHGDHMEPMARLKERVHNSPYQDFYKSDVIELIEEVAEETGVDLNPHDPLQDDIFRAKHDLEEALTPEDDGQWVEDLREEVRRQATHMMDSEGFSDWSDRGCAQGALDNVVDDCDIHADVPEGLDRKTIYDRVLEGSNFETLVDVDDYDPDYEISRANFPLKVGDRVHLGGQLLEYQDFPTDGPLFERVDEDDPNFQDVQMTIEEFRDYWRGEYV